MPNWIICKKFTFEASHQLYNKNWDEEKNTEVFGVCARNHGHSYKVFLYLKGYLTNGMVRNFNEVKKYFMLRIHSKYDHQFLNEKMNCLTTAENIAQQIYLELKDDLSQLYKVRVWETETSYAEYEE